MTLFSRLFVFFLVIVSFAVQANSDQVFSKQKFTDRDAVLVADQSGRVIYSWRADDLLVPASLTKLLTSYLAIQKWGLSHQFKTDFYQIGSQLWVKGYGDPYLISEEIEQIAKQLKKYDLNDIKSIHVDASYFSQVLVPGRSSVNDPYNAPLSAVSANFNTASLLRTAQGIVSAEPQTPLTTTAKKIATNNNTAIGIDKKIRLNLVDSKNAQTNFAEILAIKLGFPDATIIVNAELPHLANSLYRHNNSHSLGSVLTGAMKYSNNFISNQVFLKLAENPAVNNLSFKHSQNYIVEILENDFSWQGAKIEEGAGLSRNNKLNALQIDELLLLLQPYKTIFKQVMSSDTTSVFAKTGTLNGVSNYAGFIELPHQQYRFVFMFNRSTPYGYRDQILKLLVKQLSVLEPR